MNQYLADILAQPVALRDTLDSLQPTAVPAEILNDFQSGKWDRIVLTGMGSSYFALLPLYLRLLGSGFSAFLVETSELIYSRGYLTGNTLVVVASQSGASVEIVKLLDKFRSDLTFIGLTNTTNSPLGRQATYNVVTQAGQEASVACKTYMTALAAQVWLGDQLIDGPKEFTYLLEIPKLVEHYLNSIEKHKKELRQVLDGTRNIYLAGRGVSIATAGTGGLILKEAVRIGAEGMSSAAFRHGPFEMIGPETFVVVFAGCGEPMTLNKKLAEDIISIHGRVALIGADLKSNVFTIPTITDVALPILEILPVQMMTLALAELHNINAGHFHLGSKITSIE